MGLCIAGPKGLELVINEVPGVVAVGLFTKHGANVLLPGIEADVQHRDLWSLFAYCRKVAHANGQLFLCPLRYVRWHSPNKKPFSLR